MKNDAIDMFKGIVLLIITSLLVMAYTTIEKTVITPASKTGQVGLPVTPATISLVDKSKEIKAEPKKLKSTEYLLVKHYWPIDNLRLNEKNYSHRRFTLLLL